MVPGGSGSQSLGHLTSVHSQEEWDFLITLFETVRTKQVGQNNITNQFQGRINYTLHLQPLSTARGRGGGGGLLTTGYAIRVHKKRRKDVFFPSDIGVVDVFL